MTPLAKKLAILLVILVVVAILIKLFGGDEAQAMTLLG
jgi:hypothetical protein